MPKQTIPKLGYKKQRLLHPPNFAKAKYVDIKGNWRKLGPLFRSVHATQIWKPCMEEFAVWRGEESGYPHHPSDRHTLPAFYDSCDWRCDRAGKHPAFWDFACHSACHWVVDLCLFVATKAYPDIPWRILHHQKHSTVWNGDLHRPLLFDVNFSAIEVDPKEALQIAWVGRELKPSRYLKSYLHGKRVGHE